MRGLPPDEGGLQGDDVGNLAAIEKLLYRLEDARVHRTGEMLGFQEVGDRFERAIVA
jgi:hypothetical protein